MLPPIALAEDEQIRRGVQLVGAFEDAPADRREGLVTCEQVLGPEVCVDVLGPLCLLPDPFEVMLQVCVVRGLYSHRYMSVCNYPV